VRGGVALVALSHKTPWRPNPPGRIYFNDGPWRRA
jgi:hypothetical protein